MEISLDLKFMDELFFFFFSLWEVWYNQITIRYPGKNSVHTLGKPRGSGWRGRWEGGSGWGTHVNPWLFYSNV